MRLKEAAIELDLQMLLNRCLISDAVAEEELADLLPEQRARIESAILQENQTHEEE